MREESLCVDLLVDNWLLYNFLLPISMFCAVGICKLCGQTSDDSRSAEEPGGDAVLQDRSKERF